MDQQDNLDLKERVEIKEEKVFLDLKEARYKFKVWNLEIHTNIKIVMWTTIAVSSLVEVICCNWKIKENCPGFSMRGGTRYF